MTQKLSRRETLRMAAFGVAGGLLAACAPSQLPNQQAPSSSVNEATGATTSSDSSLAAAAASAETSEVTTFVAGMRNSAMAFLAQLSADQRAKATYAYSDVERMRWHWTTPGGFPRNGLPLSEMSEEQQRLALALLRASVSAAGYQKALEIMALQVDLSNDPQLYFVTVFGDPNTDLQWGWRWEGHHLSRNFSVKDEQVTVTPFFLGAWPTEADNGLRAMAREEDAARELVKALSDQERQVAIFQESTLTRHITQNQPTVTPLDPVGIAVGDLTDEQQKLVLEIIHTYLGVLPTVTAQPHFDRLQQAGLENVRFGWTGSLEPRNPHYYRLQGPTFLLEFDNSRNRGTHIHSVWRDFVEDFGG